MAKYANRLQLLDFEINLLTLLDEQGGSLTGDIAKKWDQKGNPNLGRPTLI